MKIDIKLLAIIGLAVYIIFLQQCGNKPIINNDTEVVKSDTVFVTTIDTIEFHDTIVRVVELAIPEYILVDHPEDTVSLAKRYETEVNDTLIEGTITSLVEGRLLSQQIAYTPKFPKYIIRTDSIIVDNTIVENKNKFFIGAEMGGNGSMFNISPMISLYTKKRYHYSLRYGMMDKSISLGIQKQIRFKK